MQNVSSKGNILTIHLKCGKILNSFQYFHGIESNRNLL